MREPGFYWVRIETHDTEPTIAFWSESKGAWLQLDGGVWVRSAVSVASGVRLRTSCR